MTVVPPPTRPGRPPRAVPELGAARGAVPPDGIPPDGVPPDGDGAGGPPSPGLLGPAARTTLLLVLVLAGSLLVGAVAGARGRTLVHDRMLPWILGRGLGVAAYLALTAMVALGVWLRHPWRSRFHRTSAEAVLRGHVTLAACTLTLLAGHLTSLALDRYAGVGWVGALVPFGAHYRPTGVALGTLAFYGVVLVAGTAALAGSIGRRVWFPVHTVSVLVFCLTLAHGALSGSDGYTLRWVYVASGVLVLGLQATRWAAGAARRGSAAVGE